MKKYNIFIMIVMVLTTLFVLNGCTTIGRFHDGTFVTPYNYENEYIDRAIFKVKRESLNKDIESLFKIKRESSNNDGELLKENKTDKLFSIKLTLMKDNSSYNVVFSNIKYKTFNTNHSNNYSTIYESNYSVNYSGSEYSGICNISAYPLKYFNNYDNLTNTVGYTISFEGDFKDKVDSITLLDFDTCNLNDSMYVSNKTYLNDVYYNFYIKNTNDLKLFKEEYQNLDYLMSSSYYLTRQHGSSKCLDLSVTNVKVISLDGNSFELTFNYNNNETITELKANMILMKEKDGYYIDLTFNSMLSENIPLNYKLYGSNSNKMYKGTFSADDVKDYGFKKLNLEIIDSFFVTYEQYDPINDKMFGVLFTCETDDEKRVEIVINRIDYKLGTEYAKFLGYCYFEFYNGYKDVEYQKIYHRFEIRFIDEKSVTVVFYDFENDSPDSKIIKECKIDLKNNQ